MLSKVFCFFFSKKMLAFCSTTRCRKISRLVGAGTGVDNRRGFGRGTGSKSRLANGAHGPGCVVGTTAAFGGRGVQGDSLCAAPRWPASLAPAATPDGMAGCSRCRLLRCCLPAAADEVEQRCRRRERGLPLSECVESGDLKRHRTAGDGVHSRRRICRRQRRGTAL